ncbi:MAG TPA: DUF5680 domain-containing protein [Chloroflexia bacterium]|nr:DUF5680 domain-containing protein [Chloroflexia bacterium]
MTSTHNIPTGDKDTMPFDTVDFTSFLVEAKRNAAPASDPAVAGKLMPGAVYLRHARGLYTYSNLYCGYERFSGQETVHYNNKPIWGMGYAGGLVDHYMWDLQPQWIYAVLRSALGQVSEELPFRGPLKYEYYGFEYINHPLGHLGEFLGEETIKYRQALVYHLWYVGGFIR